MQNNKGIYGIVTTFLFILVALVVIMGSLFYSLITSKMSSQLGEKSNIYTNAFDIKEKLLNCYGNNRIIDPTKINNKCDINYGYNITVMDYGNCTGKILKNLTKEYNQKFVFQAPILGEDNISICLGKIEIFI